MEEKNKIYVVRLKGTNKYWKKGFPSMQFTTKYGHMRTFESVRKAKSRVGEERYSTGKYDIVELSVYISRAFS